MMQVMNYECLILFNSLLECFPKKSPYAAKLNGEKWTVSTKNMILITCACVRARVRACECVFARADVMTLH